MADILLTHSYFLRFDPKEYRSMMPYPPLATLYAASHLRANGFSVALHDVMLAEREEEILASIQIHRPKLVVIYDDCFNYLTKMCLTRMREAAFKLAEIAKREGCMVVVFSSDATDQLEKYFSHNVDYVICGEAEQTLTELSEFFLKQSRHDRKKIAGLAYMQDGEIVRTPPREVLKKLDKLPFPSWDLVDLNRYKSVWNDRHGFFSINMVTTRGCPFHCNWCAKPIYGQVYHSRSPENVVEEMKFLKKLVQPDHIWFADDIFGLKPGWVAKFDEMVNQQHATIPFKCLSRVDLLLQEDTIQHLKNAGCQTVWVGAESGSQKILDAMEKGTSVGEIYEATRLLHTIGIRVGFFLQFGYPGETKEDIEKTFRMVKDCQPDEIGISVSYPLPGTKFYDRVKTELGEKQNWSESGDLAMMFVGEYSPDYYKILHRVVHKRFGIWRGQHAVKNILQHPLKITKRALRSVGAMVFNSITLPYELRKLKISEQLTH
ncbi:MAG: radical SAM protein [Ignavibacteriales bacterium]|nr:radical SAM protein [Ignavibacteriales bacterium]